MRASLAVQDSSLDETESDVAPPGVVVSHHAVGIYARASKLRSHFLLRTCRYHRFRAFLARKTCFAREGTHQRMSVLCPVIMLTRQSIHDGTLLEGLREGPTS